jgi:hypothetical protein
MVLFALILPHYLKLPVITPLFTAISSPFSFSQPSMFKIFYLHKKTTFRLEDGHIALLRKVKEERRDTVGNDFEQFMLPNCILRLKQRFGRLIRTVNEKELFVPLYL